MSVTNRCKTVTFSPDQLDALEHSLRARLEVTTECLAFMPGKKRLQLEHRAAMEALAIVLDAAIEEVPA
jgi:hypothetical protein